MNNEAMLAGLLGRHSQGIRHLGEPGPDDAALRTMATAALRAPDHAGLVPFRFVVVRGAARARAARKKLSIRPTIMFIYRWWAYK